MNLLKNTEPLTIHPVVKKVLATRGISEAKDLEKFFSWDLKSIPDLTQLIDLETGAQRVYLAIKNNEKIGIYGDYDVDGTTSCALFYHFFQMIGSKVELFQPSRFVEGYGVHPSSIDNALEKEVRLLITVDCGISNIETADYAKEKGLDLIITDHHKDAREKMPDALAVINPNRRDEVCHEDLKSLAGVGVAFAFCLKLREIMLADQQECPSLYPLLQFFSLGTICDLARLTDTNKTLTRHGLKIMKDTPVEGIKLFLTQEDYAKPFLESEKCSFYIGPHINSRGRLEHPEFALNMITTSDPVQARSFYDEVVKSNTQRKIIQKKVYDEAFEQTKKNFDIDESTISIAFNPSWHEGVIGIVASRLVETFRVPAIVFTEPEEGILKASARTAGELNLFELLDSCRDLFIKFGGHKAAAGLSMKKENLPQLRKRLQDALKEIPAILRTKQDSFDIEVNFQDLDLELVRNLQRMEPFGQGNPYPVFRIKDAYLAEYNILKDSHLKWVFKPRNQVGHLKKTLNGISFNYLNSWNTTSPEELLKKQRDQALIIDAKLQINYFRNKRYLQLLVEKIYTDFDSLIV